jgi:hypothetical protein
VEVLCFLPSAHYSLYDFDLRATHVRTLLPAALASVSFGFVLVRVRVVTPTTVTALNNRAEITKRQGRFAIGARVKSFAPDGNRVKLEVEDLDTGEVSIFCSA